MDNQYDCSNYYDDIWAYVFRLVLTVAIDTAQDLYEFVMNTFAATAFHAVPRALESITRHQYNFINGYTFGAKDNDHKFLYDGSYFDTANNYCGLMLKQLVR